MKKLIVGFGFFFMSCLIIMVCVTYAWFYFPANQNMDIATPSDLPVNINVYHLTEEDTLELIQVINPDTDTAINVGTNMAFFQWGFEFLIEDAKTEYYVLDCTYESSAFKEGKLKLVIDSNLTLTSDVEDEDEDGNPLYSKFTFVECNYAFSNNASLDLTTTEAVKYLKESVYTNIDAFSDVKINDDEQITIINDVVEQNLRQFDSTGNAYNKQISTEPVDYILRFIIFIRIDPDTDNISEAFDSIRFGDAIYVNAVNEYEFNISFKTDPTKID